MRKKIFQNILFFFLYLLLGVSCSQQNRVRSIQGRVTLTPALASKLSPSDVLFIFAYPEIKTDKPPAGSKSPESQTLPYSSSPVAVLKIAPVIFPVHYDLSEQEIMFPEKRLEGNFWILVKIDKDGDAKTTTPGDLEGTYKKNPARAGDDQVDMVINKER